MGVVTKAVTEENKAKAIARAKAQGWELHKLRMLTNHPDDHYLMVAMSETQKGEWAVHLYNSDFDGFTEGFYTDDKLKAIDKYYEKS
jgi:hypothetical protein